MSAMHFYSNATLPFILAKNSVCVNGMLRVIEYISTGNSMVNTPGLIYLMLFQALVILRVD